MCFQIHELYVACKCLYYQHPLERCESYGHPGHSIISRVVYVGYACGAHIGYLAPDEGEAASDTNSVFDTASWSSRSSASSVSGRSREKNEDALEELLQGLLRHPQLQHLFPQLVRQSRTVAQSETNMARFLRRYSTDLRQSAATKAEIDASSFVRRSRVSIARRISESHSHEIEEAAVIENQVQVGIDDVMGLDADEDERGEAETVLASYDNLRHFLFDGPPFASLRSGLELFISKPALSPIDTITTRVKNLFANTYTGFKYKDQQPTSPTRKGLWWTCQCGRSVYDTYEELRPGAVEDLRVFLAQYGSATPTLDSSLESGSLPPSDGNSPTASPPRQQTSTLRGFIDSFKNLTLPKYEDTAGSSLKPCASSQAPNSSQRCRFLLLCVPFMRWGIKLRQPDVCRIHSDRDFFKLLRTSYLQHRAKYRWRWFKAVSKMDFVQFEMFSSDLVNIRASPSMPSAEARQDYDYEPPDTNPPIGFNLAMHLFENPNHAEIYPILFNRTPVKRRNKLQACAPKGYARGWGVQFVESFSGVAVFVCGLVGFGICLMVSILWTWLRDDIQGGFGIGAFVLAFFIFCATNLYTLV